MKKIISAFVVLLTTTALMAKDNAQQTAQQTLDLLVTENGFEPSRINVKPATKVTLKVTRKTDSTCATQIQVPSLKIKKDLPLNETVSIELGKLKKGEIRFGCGMNMMVGGQIHVQ